MDRKRLGESLGVTTPMRHLVRNSIIALVCSFVIVLFFGWIVPDEYVGYLHAPPVPFQSVVTMPCLAGPVLGACIGSYTYLALPATADFALWFAGIFGGMLGTVTLLTVSDSRMKRLAGVAIVGALLFGIFVPVVNTASFSICGPPPSYCGPVTQYVSLSYLYLGTGAVYATSGDYRIGVAMSA